MILRYKAIVRYSVRGNRSEVNDAVEVKVKDGVYTTDRFGGINGKSLEEFKDNFKKEMLSISSEFYWKD